MAEFLYRSILMGIGATAIFDLWVLFLKHVVGIPGGNWGPVGRWFLHLAGGKVFHDDIATAQPFVHEKAAGWIGHYLVGIFFAAILLLVAPPGWTAQPTLLPPLIVGLVTVGAGWFLLQPGMGAGIAASKRPNPNQARMLNIAGHIVFGLGLYVTALLIR